MKRFVSFLLTAALVLSLVPFSAFAVEITGISYTPADEDAYTFYVGENTEVRHDDALNIDYYYYIINFNAGDVLTVQYNDGNHKDYVAEHIDGNLYFVSGDERIKQWEGIARDEDQQVNHWGIGEYTFYIVYNGFRAPLTATIKENPVDFISYTPADGVITRYFETGGQFDRDENGEEYYHYNAIEHTKGDILAVSYNDGRGDVNYVLTYDPESRYVSENDPEDFILERDIDMFDEQRNKHYALGDNNRLYVSYMGKTATVTVNIINNPVNSIVYTPAAELKTFEHTNGEWRDRDGRQVFEYFPLGFRANDTLEITYNDDRGTVVYTYLDYFDGITGAEYKGFYTNDLEPLPDENELYVCNEGEWVLGDNNFMHIEYMDNPSNAIRVTVKENPVKGIRFERSETVQFIEGTNMYHDYRDDADYYNIPYHRAGDRLVVINKDNTETVYEYCEEYRAYAADGKEDIPAEQVRFDSNQRENPWSVGDNNYTVEYLGYTYGLVAVITENPVESIDYIPANPVSFMVGTNMHHDEFDNADYYERPFIRRGDKLIVNYSDPARGRVEYTATYDEETNRMVFLSDGGDKIFEYDNFEIYDDQREHPWTVGENYYYIGYCGRYARIPVTITENNLAGISYTSVSIPQVWESDYAREYDESGNEYRHYNIPDFKDGDILTVSYTNAPDKDFVLCFDESEEDRYFINGEEKIHVNELFRSDSQKEKGWNIGLGNFYTVEFYGFTADVEVEIINTDVEGVQFVPVDEIVLDENTGGQFRYDNFDERFFEYDIRSVIKPGDKLIVRYKSGIETEYVLSIDPNTDAWHLRSAYGDELNLEDISVEDHQWENHWIAGTNYFDIKYHGVADTVPVTVRPLYMPGDINGDGKVNNKDLTRLFKYLSGWNVEVNEKALDVNGDSAVNNKDITTLFRHLSGWDVEIF